MVISAAQAVVHPGSGPAPSARWETVMWRLLREEETRAPTTGLEQFAEMTAAHARCSVLVVDDDLIIRETVAALLEDDGYVVEQAANGLEALAHLEGHLPAVVLLDMRMPLMDGWAFV